MDITVDEVKKFRTWLAKTILTFDVGSKGIQRNELFTQEQTYVLQYYANNMYDDVVKKLSGFNNQVSQQIKTSSCGCSSVDLNSLYSIESCDMLGTYRKNLYNEMDKYDVDRYRTMAFNPSKLMKSPKMSNISIPKF